MSGDGLTIERTALEALSALLLQRAGLKITPDGYHGLRLALQARMPALGISDALDYVRRLRHAAGENELRALLPLVTVGKTEFFRDSRQFDAFAREVLPRVLTLARRDGRTLRLWSAGCATGEEPWSLAMAVVEAGALEGEAEILATDVNPAAVEAASAGRYAARRLVGVSEERLSRFFLARGGDYEVGPLLRPWVRFEGHNLAAPVWPQVRAQSLDVIFCRNVIIYFDQPTIVGVMERFYESLRPGAWLFLGYSESLFKLQTRFAMTEVGGTFLYRRPNPHAHPVPPPPATTLPAPGPAPLPRPVPSAARPVPPLPRASAPSSLLTPLPLTAAERAVLTPGPQALIAARPSVPPPTGLKTPLERLDEVVQHIEAGDFPRALRLAHAIVTDLPEDLAARLTLGNVHALMGNIDEARVAYAAVLGLEPLCVEARLYLALAALQANELDEAATELTRALFLEPGLAVGHYLLGQVNERRKDLEGARRSYRNAVGLRRAAPHELIAHFPELPRSNEAVAQSAQYRLAALSEV